MGGVNRKILTKLSEALYMSEVGVDYASASNYENDIMILSDIIDLLSRMIGERALDRVDLLHCIVKAKMLEEKGSDEKIRILAKKIHETLREVYNMVFGG